MPSAGSYLTDSGSLAGVDQDGPDAGPHTRRIDHRASASMLCGMAWCSVSIRAQGDAWGYDVPVGRVL
jgi:hypothetical protein